MAPVWDTTTIRQKKWNGRFTILNDRQCSIIVSTQSFTFGTESFRSGGSWRVDQALSAVRSVKLQSWPKSWQIMLYRVIIVTMSCVVRTISGGFSTHRHAVVRNGHCLEFYIHCRVLPIESRLCPILPSETVQCQVTVESRSGKSGRCQQDSVVFFSCGKYKSNHTRIKNERIGTNSVG